jgi:hypothetical protein
VPSVRREPRFFLDGSCVAPTTSFARATGALVQLGAGEVVENVVTFAVPASSDQTAAAAEHLCAAVFDACTPAGGRAFTDCGSVFAAASGGLNAAEAERRPWAGIWRYLSWGWAAIFKVKAHLTREAARTRGEEGLWAGNAAADRAAKSRDKTLLPPPDLCDEAEGVANARMEFVRETARVLAPYPPLEPLTDDLPAESSGQGTIYFC